MQRLRRTRQREGFVPVAAEVLELRALLSSAAAAVHGATHHAAIQSGNTAVHIAPQAGFHGTVGSAVSIAGAPPQFLPGKFSIGNVKVAVGSHVSAHFTFSLNSGGTKISLKGTFVGTIASLTPAGGQTVVHITPTGGSIVLTDKPAGSPAAKATAIPNGSEVLLVLTTGTNTFFSIVATDVFKPGSPGGLSNQTIVISIGT